MGRAREKFILSGIEMQNRKNEIEHFIAPRFLVAGVGIIAERYPGNHLVSYTISLDLMQDRIAISEGVCVFRANDFDTLSARGRNRQREGDQPKQNFHPHDFSHEFILMKAQLADNAARWRRRTERPIHRSVALPDLSFQ